MFVNKLLPSETIDYDSKIYNFYVQKQYSEVSNEKPNDDDRQTTKLINFIEIIKKQRNPTYVNALYESPLIEMSTYIVFNTVQNGMVNPFKNAY